MPEVEEVVCQFVGCRDPCGTRTAYKWNKKKNMYDEVWLCWFHTFISIRFYKRFDRTFSNSHRTFVSTFKKPRKTLERIK